VGRTIIDWKFNTIDDGVMQFLPQMQTDITIENKQEKIIIDAKYYRETMSINYDKQKIHSNNLYQLFSYLVNQRSSDEKTHKAKGILLYPTIEAEYDLSYKFEDHPIQIKTLNLNQHWKMIEARLMNLISC
jgi:5-methylcytosine-specific restriction enzyme subunit McrC